jgi:hypothetical protein
LGNRHAAFHGLDGSSVVGSVLVGKQETACESYDGKAEKDEQRRISQHRLNANWSVASLWQ